MESLSEIKKLRRANLAALINGNTQKQVAVAEMLGLAPAYLHQMAFAAGKQARGIADFRARDIERAFQKPLGWLDQQHETADGKPISSFEDSRTHLVGPHNLRVPVRGTASMGMDGFWVVMEYPQGHGDGYFNIPTEDPAAYVLRVKGDSMHPAIRSGWYVLIEPGNPIQQGEYVLVKLIDGRTTVKELMWHRNGEYALLAVGNGDRLTISEGDVMDIHPVTAVLPPSKRTT